MKRLPAILGKAGISAVLMATAFLLAISSAEAGRPHVPATQPFVFTDADINVVVLSYMHDGPDQALTKIGDRLSLLVHLECLRSILKYQSVGAVQIESVPGKEAESRPDIVMDKLLGRLPGAEARMLEGHGIVMLSGRLFLQGEEIWLQSYVRFLRRARDDQMILTIAGQRVTGRLSTQSFSFPPRRLTTKELSQVEGLYGSANLVRSEPDPQSEAGPLPTSAQTRGYLVRGQHNGWMHIEAFDGSWTGWLPARFALGEVALEQKLPEIAFVDLLVGYLKFRMDLEGNRTSELASEAQAVRNAIGRFERFSRDGAGRTPLAVARQIDGMIALLAPQPSEKALQSAQGAFTDAAALLPYSADARNLVAIGRMRLGLLTPFKARATENELTGAIGLDPENEAVLANLRAYYELLETDKSLQIAKGEELPRDRIASRIQDLRSLEETRQAEAAQAQAQAAQVQAAARIAAQKQRADLLKQLNRILATQDTERGLLATMAGVNFPSGSATLQPAGRENLSKLAGILAAHPSLKVDIEGYADSAGEDEKNMELSQKRAEAVQAFLIEKGIAATSLTAKGLGKAAPVATNDTPEGRAKNRRVEIIVSGEEIGTKGGK